MSDRATCFMLEIAPKGRRSLRRFVSYNQAAKCAGPSSYHNALTAIDEIDMPLPETQPEDSIGRLAYQEPVVKEDFPHDDPRWPRGCPCGYVFQEADNWQVFVDRLWTDTRTGKLVTLEEAEPGAMWNAYWLLPFYAGPDGRCLMTKLPNGHQWCIDGMATNCGLAKGRPQGKWCWNRQGEPPRVTVGRASCPNCGVGGGSIGAPGWHGYITDGELAPA